MAAPKGSGGKKRAAKEEIDDIFASASAKKQEKQQQDGQAQLSPELLQVADAVQAARQASSKKPKVEGSKDDIFGESTGKKRKRTEEGYAIYGEEELGLNKRGGDTPQCPFDCDCCF